jgi:hypothetical protein
MKFAWLAASGLLAFAAPAFAQQAPAPAAAPAAATSADAPVDPERLALAKEMMNVFDVKATMHNMFSNMGKFVKLPEGATPDQKARAEQLFASIMVGVEQTMPDVMDKMTVVYARTFTAQEMRDVIAFYHSPSGQSMVTKLPTIMQEVMPLSMGMMPKIVTAAEADYCSHRTCDKTDHLIFTSMRAAYAKSAK